MTTFIPSVTTMLQADSMDLTGLLALRRDLERFRLLVENSQDLVAEVTLDGLIVYVSPNVRTLLGFGPRELVQQNVFDYVHPDDLPGVQAQFALPEGSVTCRFRHKNGSWRWLETSGRDFFTPEGEKHGVLIARDVTARKQAEEALRLSEEKFSKAFQTSPSCMVITRLVDGLILEVNETFARRFGTTCADARGKTEFDFGIWKSTDERDAVIRRLNEEESIRGLEKVTVLPSGEHTVALLSVERLALQGEQCLLAVSQDITGLKEAEAALRESEERTRLILENALEAVVTMSTDGFVTSWNRQAETTFGWVRGEVLGRKMSDVIIPESNRRAHEEGLKRFLVAGETRVLNRRMEMTALRRDGREIPVELSITPVRTAQGTSFSAFIRDLTGLKEAQRAKSDLEEQLRQTQKLESLGTLAGGVAHDFNNILAAIMAYTDLARMDTRGWGDVPGYLDQVLKACDRAKELVQQILTFSRQQHPERRPVKLQPVVHEVLKLLRSTLPASIDIASNVRSDTGLVLADPTQIHQVLVNLCTNAAHAMRRQPGRLEVRLESHPVDEAFARTQPELHPGRYVRLSVSDTGHGMDAETQKRIFEPFFTTKALGEGTGLGLAVVHGIAKDHDAVIQVISAPDEGSTFHLFFPVLETETEAADTTTRVVPQGRGQHLLFVDDEPAICGVAERILRRMNYTVTIRKHPREALHVFCARPDEFDLVITDLQMPGMTGVDLALELLKVRPGLPVLLASGFSGTWTPDQVRSLGIRDIVPKPMTSAALAEAIQRALTPRHSH